MPAVSPRPTTIGKTQGRYRTEPAGNRGCMAYVVDGFSASYVTEAVYRAKGYKPDFDDLPAEDEYDTAKACSGLASQGKVS